MGRALTAKELDVLAKLGNAGDMHVGEIEAKGWMSAAAALEDLGYIRIERARAYLTRKGRKTV